MLTFIGTGISFLILWMARALDILAERVLRIVSCNSSFQEILTTLPDDFNHASNLDKELLVILFTKLVVFRTLFSFPSGKSPGPDGLNCEFYLCFWKYSGDRLFVTINHFLLPLFF